MSCFSWRNAARAVKRGFRIFTPCADSPPGIEQRSWPTLCVVWLALTCRVRIPSPRRQPLDCRLTGAQDVHSHSETVVLLVDPATCGVAFPTLISTQELCIRLLLPALSDTTELRQSVDPLRTPSHVKSLGCICLVCAPPDHNPCANREALCTLIEELCRSDPSISGFHFCHSHCESRLHEPAREFAIHHASQHTDNIRVVGIHEIPPPLQLWFRQMHLVR